MRKKIGIVVQRCGKEVIGGSESYALQMGYLLSQEFFVDILTTTARDHVTWKNEYKPGEEKLNNSLLIRRFLVEKERAAVWHEFDKIMAKRIPLEVFLSLDKEKRNELFRYVKGLPLGFCNAWMKMQGPISNSLFSYIEHSYDNYDYLIFITYLFASTYYGIQKVLDKEKVYLIPTYHDEIAAYLPIFERYKAYHHLFLSDAEREVAEQSIYKEPVCSEIIGFGIKDQFNEVDEKEGRDLEVQKNRYILYAGRIEAAKGVLELYHYFSKYCETEKDIKLYLIGDGDLKNYEHPRIVYKGFVSEKQKFTFMKHALAFVHPSSFESLGIVLLEAFMMGTPALVNGKSAVLKNHIDKSKGGYAYSSYEEFANYLDILAKDRVSGNFFGNNGRKYFLKNYEMSVYKSKLLEIFE